MELFTCRDFHRQMLSIQGVAVPQSKEICSSPIVRPALHSLHAQKYASYAVPMPVEVISNILGLTSHSSHDPTSQSISLSHVCGRWRQITLSMPCLWSFISLSLPLSKGQLMRMRACLIRSRHHPLDIHMDFRDPAWDWDETSHIFGSKAMDSLVMHSLVPQASRWRSIELLTDTWAPIFTFLSCTAAIDSAPLLQTIRLARCNEYFVAQGEVFLPTDLAVPVAWFGGGTALCHLRHVSLSGVHVDWTRSGLTGLRELELRYHAQDVMPTLSEFQSILRANAALKRLVILGWGPRMDHSPLKHESDDLQTIDLPQLEELEFGFVDVAYAIDLLSLFALPNLRALSLEDVASGIQLHEHRDCSRLFDHLVEMNATERTPPRMPLSCLRALSLRSTHATDDASVRGLFGGLCAVTSLCLDRVDATSLLAICSALGSCDRLQVLTFKDVDAAAAALVLASHSLPPRLRIFLDIDEEEEEEEDQDEGEGVDCHDIGGHAVTPL